MVRETRLWGRLNRGRVHGGRMSYPLSPGSQKTHGFTQSSLLREVISLEGIEVSQPGLERLFNVVDDELWGESDLDDRNLCFMISPRPVNSVCNWRHDVNQPILMLRQGHVNILSIYQLAARFRLLQEMKCKNTLHSLGCDSFLRVPIGRLSATILDTIGRLWKSHTVLNVYLERGMAEFGRCGILTYEGSWNSRE
jgi:hypothetical protein